MEFAASIHCMDGRIQEPIISFIKHKYGIKYIDTITEAGPCRILAENTDNLLIESICRRIDISIKKHQSEIIFVSGHHDCAGNPVPKDTQLRQLKKSSECLRQKYTETRIIRLWVNSQWEAEEL